MVRHHSINQVSNESILILAKIQSHNYTPKEILLLSLYKSLGWPHPNNLEFEEMGIRFSPSKLYNQVQERRRSEIMVVVGQGLTPAKGRQWLTVVVSGSGAASGYHRQ